MTTKTAEVYEGITTDFKGGTNVNIAAAVLLERAEFERRTAVNVEGSNVSVTHDDPGGIGFIEVNTVNCEWNGDVKFFPKHDVETAHVYLENCLKAEKNGWNAPVNPPQFFWIITTKDGGFWVEVSQTGTHFTDEEWDPIFSVPDRVHNRKTASTLLTIYQLGFTRGEKYGEQTAKHAIRKALGL